MINDILINHAPIPFGILPEKGYDGDLFYNTEDSTLYCANKDNIWEPLLLKEQSRFEEIQSFIDDNLNWSIKTFGDLPVTAVLKHLSKEVVEVIQGIENQEPVKDIKVEFADCFLLLVQSAKKFGIDFEELFEISKEKQEINKIRTWGKINSEGFSEHVEGISISEQIENFKEKVEQDIKTIQKANKPVPFNWRECGV